MASEPAAEPAPTLQPEDRYVVGPGPDFRLVRTWQPPSVAKRRIWAGLLLLPGIVVAFPRIVLGDQGGAAGVLLWLVLYFLWVVPTDHLFVAPERIHGMRPVRKEVWVRPSERAGEPASIVIDGLEVGSALGAEVWVYGIQMLRPFGRTGSWYFTEYRLALVTGGSVQLLDHHRAPEVPRREAHVLLRGIGRPAPAIREKAIGREPWPLFDPAVALIAIPYPAMAAAIAAHGHLPSDAFVLGLGLCTLAARAAVTLQRFAVANGRLLDTRAFGKTFSGARPVVAPLRWLTPRAGRIVFWTTMAVLAGLTASMALGPR